MVSAEIFCHVGGWLIVKVWVRYKQAKWAVLDRYVDGRCHLEKWQRSTKCCPGGAQLSEAVVCGALQGEHGCHHLVD